MTASGPHCVRNRYYDPATGRFTQPDPIGLAGGLNLYGYADGDPINKSDPFGLCPEDITGKPCLNPLGGRPLDVRPGIGGFGENAQRTAGVHGGLDLLAPKGSDVTAASDGIFEMRSDPNGLGDYAVVWHGKSATVYGHLSGFAEGLKTGSRVRAGQVIGSTGDSGNAKGTPDHLHFEIWVDFNTVGRGGTTGRRDPDPELRKAP
jgi:murein DD-endopeptidase MepM/ murein hydrolase activator NlpD